MAERVSPEETRSGSEYLGGRQADAERQERANQERQEAHKVELTGLQAIDSRTNKPLMPSVFSDWRKGLYSKEQTRLEAERTGLEAMLQDKRADIESRMQANIANETSTINEVYKLEREIAAYGIELNRSDISDAKKAEYRSMTDMVSSLLAEAKINVNEAQIIREIEQEDLNTERKWAEIAYGENILSHKAREAKIEVSLFWLTDRRWPGQLKQDKHTLRSLGALIMLEETAKNKRLSGNWYSRDGGMPVSGMKADIDSSPTPSETDQPQPAEDQETVDTRDMEVDPEEILAPENESIEDKISRLNNRLEEIHANKEAKEKLIEDNEAEMTKLTDEQKPGDDISAPYSKLEHATEKLRDELNEMDKEIIQIEQELEEAKKTQDDLKKEKAKEKPKPTEPADTTTGNEQPPEDETTNETAILKLERELRGVVAEMDNLLDKIDGITKKIDELFPEDDIKDKLIADKTILKEKYQELEAQSGILSKELRWERAKEALQYHEGDAIKIPLAGDKFESGEISAIYNTSDGIGVEYFTISTDDKGKTIKKIENISYERMLDWQEQYLESQKIRNKQKQTPKPTQTPKQEPVDTNPEDINPEPIPAEPTNTDSEQTPAENQSNQPEEMPENQESSESTDIDTFIDTLRELIMENERKIDDKKNEVGKIQQDIWDTAKDNDKNKYNKLIAEQNALLKEIDELTSSNLELNKTIDSLTKNQQTENQPEDQTIEPTEETTDTDSTTSDQNSEQLPQEKESEPVETTPGEQESTNNSTDLEVPEEIVPEDRQTQAPEEVTAPVESTDVVIPETAPAPEPATMPESAPTPELTLAEREADEETTNIINDLLGRAEKDPTDTSLLSQIKETISKINDKNYKSDLSDMINGMIQ